MYYNSDVVIFYFDKYIDQTNECEKLKQALSTMLHPEWASSIYVSDNNPHRPLICNMNEKLYSYKTDAVEVYMCSDEDIFLDYFQQKKNKRLFLIGANIPSEKFLLEVIEKYPNVLAKSIEDHRISVYLLHTNLAQTKNEFGNRQQNIQVFTDESALLAQLACAIADHFLIVGQNQLNHENVPCISQGLKYFQWAKTLYQRADDFQRSVNTNDHISIVDNYILKAKNLLEQVRDPDEQIDARIAFNHTLDRSIVDTTDFNQQHGWASPLSFNGGIIAEVENHGYLVESESTISTDIAAEKSSAKPSCSHLNIYLLESSFSQETFLNIFTDLTRIFGKTSTIITKQKDYNQLLKMTDSSIIVLSLSTSDYESLLEKLCSLTQPPAIYLFGSQPTTIHEKEAFFNKYHSVCDISNNPHDLVVRIAVDLAMKHRILADRSGRQQNKHSALNNYDQCIDILHRLNDFAERNVDMTD